MDGGGLTLGPVGGGTGTAPPSSAADAAVVVVDAAAVVVVVVRCEGTEVVALAPGRLGELEQADAASASVANTGSTISPTRGRMGVTRQQAIVSASATNIGNKDVFEGCGMPVQSTVRPATEGDVAQVARLHIEAIHEGFLSSLGTAFLRRLYARLCRSRHGFLLVADGTSVGDDGVVGFVAGSTSLRDFYREFVWRDGLAASLSSAPTLARSLRRVLETLRYGTGSDSPAESDNEAELLAIGVSQSARRLGTGGALARAFLETSARNAATTARVVVGSENAAAIALYEACGFRVAQELELHAGVRSLVMRTDVPAPTR
jgi:ribosomal protein S18 acetylase RimI-like enzyme